MSKQTQQQRYQTAVESFVDKVRGDPNVIAVIVYGSVAQGTVWEKSDVDIIVVVRDQKLANTNYGIYEDNITFGLDICQRSDLRRMVEKSLGGSFGHSLNATSKIVFTCDESLYEYFEDAKRIGRSDMERGVFDMANDIIGMMEKVEKWLVVKRDPEYARLYLIKAVEAIARLEVIRNYQVPTREAILQAEAINPSLMETFYREPMSRRMAEGEIRGLLHKMDGYVMSQIDTIMDVIREFFGDGEVKTGTMITKHFGYEMHMMHSILDYLSERGYLDKVSQTIRITPKSKLAVEEVAYIMPQ